MDRNKARKLISGIFDIAADDMGTDRLEAMKLEIEAQIQSAHMKGLYQKIADALAIEIQARRQGEMISAERSAPHIRSQMQ